MNSIFQWQPSNSYIHRLNGVSKLLCFLMLTFAVMLSYDVRFICGVAILSLLILFTSKIDLKLIKWMFIYALVYLTINAALTFLFAPLHGVSIYGTRHELFAIFGDYVVTSEQLLYQGTQLLKYITVIPVGMLLFLTTNPSDLAASMNRIGVHYKVCVAFALTLRYLPQVTSEFHDISLAQQARGIDLSKKAKLSTRIKNAVGILIPLIFSSLDRVEYIANAMDLRGFGKHNQRTWYKFRSLESIDYVSLIFCGLIFFTGLGLSIFVNHSRFFNPFI